MVFSTTVRSTSHIHATSTSGFFANMRARARPLLFVPITPTITLLLGEPRKLKTLGATNSPAPARADCLINVRRVFLIVWLFFVISNLQLIYSYPNPDWAQALDTVNRLSGLERRDVVRCRLQQSPARRLCCPCLMWRDDTIGCVKQWIICRGWFCRKHIESSPRNCALM